MSKFYESLAKPQEQPRDFPHDHERPPQQHSLGAVEIGTYGFGEPPAPIAPETEETDMLSAEPAAASLIFSSPTSFHINTTPIVTNFTGGMYVL